MNLVRRGLAIALLLLLTGAHELAWPPPQSTTITPQVVVEAFTALKNLALRSPGVDTEIHRLRQVFLRNGDDSGRYLVAQLQQLNEDEWRHVSGPDDVDGGMDYVISTFLDHHLNPLLKMHVANLLADLYPQLSPGVQTAVLETLATSLTPSTHERQTGGLIGYSFHRIGAASIPYLLGMLSNQSKFVRCYARDELNHIVRESLRNKALLPQLPCEEVSAGKSEAAVTWMSWWQANEGHIEVKEVPSIFDIIYGPPKAPHQDSHIR